MMKKKVPTRPLAEYTVVDHAEVKDHMCFGIESGKFKGTVFRFDTVKVGESLDDEDNAVVRFTYTVLENEFNTKGNQDFEHTIASILYHIIETTAEMNANRNDGASAPTT
jgi:hypothetical protein